MTDAYCKKHFIAYCPDLSATCPYCEVERLRSEVREWICADCDTVYPGPPTEGFDCVQCPKCKGPTAPRLRVEVERLRRNDELQMNRAITAERKLARLEQLWGDITAVCERQKELMDWALGKATGEGK